MEFFAMSSCCSIVEVSRTRAIMIASISRCAISSVPVSSTRSWYFTGARDDHLWKIGHHYADPGMHHRGDTVDELGASWGSASAAAEFELPT
jgi:hypothetical protein